MSPCLSACFCLTAILACLVAGGQAQSKQHTPAFISELFLCCTVTLTPAVLCVLPGESVATFKCETLTSSLLWIYESTVHQIFYTKDSTLNVPESLGPCVVVQLNSIVTNADGTSVTLSSTATVNVSSLTNVTRNLTITCDGNGDGVDGRDALLIVANGMFTPEILQNLCLHQ